MTKYGMVFDLRYCIRSRTCYVACKVVNKISPDKRWHKRLSFLEYEEGEYPNVIRHFIQIPCMQCENPICLDICQTDAIFKSKEGVVLIDKDRCNGCQHCIIACPYGAIYFNEDEGIVDKCDFCYELGLEPECVKYCQSRSIKFGDLDDPESEVSKLVSSGKAKPLLSELGLKPKVFYIWYADRIPSYGGELVCKWVERWKQIHKDLKH